MLRYACVKWSMLTFLRLVIMSSLFIQHNYVEDTRTRQRQRHFSRVTFSCRGSRSGAEFSSSGGGYLPPPLVVPQATSRLRGITSLFQVACGVEPDVLCFAAATRCCCKRGDWESAISVLEATLRKGLLPASRTIQVKPKHSPSESPCDGFHGIIHGFGMGKTHGNVNRERNSHSDGGRNMFSPPLHLPILIP